MINIIKRSAVAALLLIMIPFSGVLADTAETPSAEESSEQPVFEESAEQEGYEESTEASVEDYNETTEEEVIEESPDEYVPPQNDQPQYEETTEAPYQSYEEPTEEFNYEEETAEETEEEWTEEPNVEVTEEVTEAPAEEMTEEVTAEPVEEMIEEETAEPVDEPADVTINQAAVDEFSIAGEVVSDSGGVEGVTVTLSGDKDDETKSDVNGEFSFNKVPAGEYELHVEMPEGYTAEKETHALTLEDRGKRGITFVMEEQPGEEQIETDDQIKADKDVDSSNNMPIILVGVVLLAAVLILFLVKALKR